MQAKLTQELRISGHDSIRWPTNRENEPRAIERNITANREILMAGVQLSPSPNKARTRNTPKATSLMQNYADVSIPAKSLNSQKGLKLSPFLLSRYPFNFFLHILSWGLYYKTFMKQDLTDAV